MRRVRILASEMPVEDLKAVSQLAMQAGFFADEIDVVKAVEAPVAHCDDEVMLVVLSPTICQRPGLEAELVKAHNGGTRRTIAVWPRDVGHEAVPPDAALKYCYSIVRWDADKLRAVAADDDVLCFETPSGERLPNAPMPRNCCVEESD